MTRRSRLRFLVEGVEGAGLLLAAGLSWPVSRRWLADWGSRRDERERTWPGDRLVSEDAAATTRAIDIRAPASTVWSWIVQLGLGRAGFYSYELLERLADIPVTNVESIEPALQALAVGDEIRLHPKAPGIPVASVEPGRWVCFGGPRADPSGEPANPGRSWSIYVERRTPGTCRLIVRSRVERPRRPTWRQRVFFAVEESVDYVMEQRMLRTVRRLAETRPD